MPDLATLVLFVSASFVLLVVPGPTIALVVARSLSEGRAVALPLVAGVGLGDLVAASASLLGVGALLAASAQAFTVVKVIGAFYLIWMGVRLWRSEPVLPEAGETVAASGRLAFRDSFLVTVLNPKGILFFIAFVPQFIVADRPFWSQAAVFVVVFTLLGMANGLAYAFGADVMRGFIRRPAILRAMNRAGGAVITAAGLAALFTRRPAV